MIDEIDAQAILDGARGDPPVDRDALVDVLLSVSRLVADNPDVSEVDLNPVLAGEDGAEILDASIVLEAAADGDDGDERRREKPDAVADGGDGGVDE